MHFRRRLWMFPEQDRDHAVCHRPAQIYLVERDEQEYPLTHTHTHTPCSLTHTHDDE